MTKQVMIYEVKSVASINAKALFSDDSNFFYWNHNKFKNLVIGDFIFVVNRSDSWVLFTQLDKSDISTTIDGDSTVFFDLGKRFKVKGVWEYFIRLKIVEKLSMPLDWEWKSLGSSETTYLNGNRIGKESANNRILNIQQLMQLTDDASINQILEDCRLNFLQTSPQPKPINMPLNPRPESEPIIVNDDFITASIVLEQISKHIKSKGFNFTKEEIANFYLSLKTKPFVILAGISGTGKTQLPRLFAQSIGMEKEQLIQIPVRPDWTDASDLLGYTSLDNKYIPKALTLAIIEAVKDDNKSKPYFFILDEMNLARVEHYFSDFLSVIETRTRQGNEVITDLIIREEDLKNVTNNSEFKGLHWPENLYLIGTVNMDETTHSFSRKVLDRANTIEMNEVDLNWLKSNNSTPPEKALVDNSFIKSEFINAIDLDENAQKLIKDEMKLLFEVNDILKIADLHFAYRVRNEIAFYLIYAANDGVLDKDTALDFQLMQKILPRIHGSALRIQMVLVNLLNLLAATEYDAKSPDMDDIRKRKDNIVNQAAYKRSVRKLIFMLERFDEDRFTSYWL